jgi:hypothetical protein
MDELLNQFGPLAWCPVALGALPLVLLGLVLRRRERRREATLAEVRAATRQVRAIAPGLVAIAGSWRQLGAIGLIEDASGAVLVEQPFERPRIPDGETALVFGCAARQADDPRSVGYRDGKLWVIDAREPGSFVAVGHETLDRERRVARVVSRVGAALFTVGMLLALGSGVVAWRASAVDAAPQLDSE